VYSDEYVEDFNAKPDSLGRALLAAQRAVKLDPASPRAHMMLGKVQFFMHDIDAFVPAAKRAVALNPNNADILAWYGVLWTYGHWADPVTQARGVEAMKRAIAMSPIYPSWYHLPIAWTYYANGDYPAASAEAKKVDMPDYFWTHQLLAAIYGAMGRQDDARAPVAKLLELYPAFPQEVRQIWKKWNVPDFVIDKVTKDLRRAGMDIPERESSKHVATTSNE
jgi:tetratricopeptide (TPR) repeat protein